MNLYEKFEELITKHKTEVLDNSEWCKVFFRKAGLREDNLEIRLFFLLLDKNVALEIRKITYKRNLSTDYNIAIAVYAKMFDSLSVPNVCEEILIRHIIGIINVFKKRRLIDFDYVLEEHNSLVLDNLQDSVTMMIKTLTPVFLSDSARVEGYLRDISGNSIDDFEIKSFLVFIIALNAENVKFSKNNMRNLYFLKILDNALNESELIYEPLERQKRYFQKEVEEDRNIDDDRNKLKRNIKDFIFNR